MDSFRIEFARSATKDLRGIDRQWIPRILEAIENLADNPLPVGCKKLVGSEHTFRIRVGDYRIVYDIQGSELVVYVVRVRHRRDVYRT
jgi:mRNA interferase RelE/StbE